MADMNKEEEPTPPSKQAKASLTSRQQIAVNEFLATKLRRAWAVIAAASAIFGAAIASWAHSVAYASAVGTLTESANQVGLARGRADAASERATASLKECEDTIAKAQKAKDALTQAENDLEQRYRAFRLKLDDAATKAGDPKGFNAAVEAAMKIPEIQNSIILAASQRAETLCRDLNRRVDLAGTALNQLQHALAVIHRSLNKNSNSAEQLMDLLRGSRAELMSLLKGSHEAIYTLSGDAKLRDPYIRDFVEPPK